METGNAIRPNSRRAPPAAVANVSRPVASRRPQIGERTHSGHPSSQTLADTAAAIRARSTRIVVSPREGHGAALNHNQLPVGTATVRSGHNQAVLLSENAASIPRRFSLLPPGVVDLRNRPNTTPTQRDTNGAPTDATRQRASTVHFQDASIIDANERSVAPASRYHREPRQRLHPAHSAPSLLAVNGPRHHEHLVSSAPHPLANNGSRQRLHSVPSNPSMLTVNGPRQRLRSDPSVSSLITGNGPPRRPQSFSSVPLLPTNDVPQQGTYMAMQDQYERSPTYLPQLPKADLGHNYSTHSTGYTMGEIRERRGNSSSGFPEPENAFAFAASERRFVGAPFMDTPRIGSAAVRERKNAQWDVSLAEKDVEKAEKRSRMSGFWAKTFGKKNQRASSAQHYPTSSPPGSQSPPSLDWGTSVSILSVSTPPMATAYAVPVEEETGAAAGAQPLPSLFQIRLPVVIEEEPVSPLNDANALAYDTQGLSPVSPLSEAPVSSGQKSVEHKSGSPVTRSSRLNLTKEEEKLMICLGRPTTTARRHVQAPYPPFPTDDDDVVESELEDSRTSDQDLYPDPLVIRKRWTLQLQDDELSEALAMENTNWSEAKAERIVAKGKGRLLDHPGPSVKQSSLQRGRVQEAPTQTVVGAGVADGMERRDTAVEEKADEKKAEDDGNSSDRSSWHTDDTRKFSHCVAMSGLRP